MRNCFLWISKNSSFWDGVDNFWNEDKGFRILTLTVDKAATGFEKTDSNFEKSYTVDKIVSDSIACYRDIIHERKSQSMKQTSYGVLF